MATFLESLPALAGTPFQKRLVGYFTTVNDAAPTGLVLSQKGAATVARTGEGVWTITLTEQYAYILYANVRMLSTDATVFEDRVQSINRTTKVITYQHREAANDAATPLAAADNPGEIVIFEVDYLIANTVLDSV
jgi:hypothetical protein